MRMGFMIEIGTEMSAQNTLESEGDGVDDVPTHVGEGACIKTSSSLCIIKFTEDDNSSLSLR